MQQITIAVEDNKILPHLKKILNALDGVYILKPSRKTSKPKTDITNDIVNGLEEIKLIKEGKMEYTPIETLLKTL